MFFADRFAEIEQTKPSNVAIVFKGREITYGELMPKGWQVANGLLALGAERQERIGYLGKNSPKFFEVFVGACASGYATAGINWRLAAPEILEIVNYTENTVLFVGKEFYNTVESIEASFTRVRHIIAVDGGHDRWPDFDQWRDQQPARRPQITLDPDDDVLHLYTSGTTGLPKGVQLTNQGYANTFKAFVDNDICNVDEHAVFINVMPLFHIGGINFTVFPLLCGARFHLLVDFETGPVLDVLTQEKVTNALFVPAMIQMLLQDPTVRGRDYSHLKLMYYGASPIAEALLLEAVDVFGCNFMQLYGATENYGLITRLAPEDHAVSRNKLRSCGKPVMGARVKIVDTDNNELPLGEVGEILLQCDWILKGYWKKPDATDEVKDRGWYRTGDAACLDEEGFVYIKDRVKDMIVTGGENVFPAEVENALYSHPDIADVAVIGVPHPTWGEAIKAMVVLKPGATLDEAQIIEYAHTRIAGYKTPKSVDFIDELPRNPSGKILRRELRAPYWAGQTRMVG